MQKKKLLAYKIITILISCIFLFNNTSYSLSFPKNNLAAPKFILQGKEQTPPTEKFKVDISRGKEEAELLQVAFKIAFYILDLGEYFEEDLIKELRKDSSLSLCLHKLLSQQIIDLKRVKIDKEKVVWVPFELKGKRGTIGIRKATSAEESPGWERADNYEFIIKYDEAVDNEERDFKGKYAPETDAVIRKLIEEERIVEISFEEEQLKAHRVKWDEGYVPGETPKRMYLGEEIAIEKLFSESEVKNLISFFKKHPVRFRIAREEPALGWRKDISHSNIAHAGYKDQCVYSGHFLLKYLMEDGKDREKLRKEILEEHELLLLLDSTNIEELHSGEVYQKKLKVVDKIVDRLVKLNRIRKNIGYLWDPELVVLQKTADAMLLGSTENINDSVVSSLWKQYKNYLRGGKEQQALKESLNLKENEVILYSSMEYAPNNELPFFAGGLGVLAGDHARAASDLLPDGTFVTVGGYYKLGYLAQKIDEKRNWQEEAYSRIKIEKFGEIVVDEEGNDVIIDLPMPEGNTIYLKAWKVQAGRTQMYFLTTDIDENNDHSGYKDYLNLSYDADEEKRIVQEYLVGVGGECLIKRLGMESKVLHINEGHVAFVLLEKARQYILKKIDYLNKKTGLGYNMETLKNMPLEKRKEYGLTLNQALETVVRHIAGFTSHTPIEAGNQKFQNYIAKKYLEPYLNSFGTVFEDIAFNPVIHDGVFDMTEFALSYCNFFNGVSREHAEVCRRMYESSNKVADKALKRKRPRATYITNAVNRRFFQPKEMREVLRGKLLILQNSGNIGENVSLDNISEEHAKLLVNSISDRELEELFQTMRTEGIKELLSIRSPDAKPGSRILPLFDGDGKEAKIDPDAFIVIFGRRVDQYKRPAFVLEPVKEGDIEVWRSVVREARNIGKNAQIIFMGKAHRTNDEAKQILQKILHIAKTDEELKGTILFVENYDTEVAKAAIKIASVPFNNPIPGKEACQTSGMKFLLDGKPSVTVLSGWPLEAYLGIFPFVSKEELRNLLTGKWRFINQSGRLVEGKDLKRQDSYPSQTEEVYKERTIYECQDPQCRHVWAVKKEGEVPQVCTRCKSPAIKNNSYHELGLLDLYFNHKERWYQLMRESLVQGLSYFTSHRMFKQYVEKMYKPNIMAANKAEKEFMNIRVNELKGSTASALRAIYSSKLKQKTDISFEKDFFPIRANYVRKTTAYNEFRMLKALGILVEGTKLHTYQLQKEIRNLPPMWKENICRCRPEMDWCNISSELIPIVKANIWLTVLNFLDVLLVVNKENNQKIENVKIRSNMKDLEEFFEEDNYSIIMGYINRIMMDIADAVMKKVGVFSVKDMEIDGESAKVVSEVQLAGAKVPPEAGKRKRRKKVLPLIDQIMTPDKIREPKSYTAYKIADLVEKGEINEARLLFFTTETFQGRRKNLDMPAEMLNNLIMRYGREETEDIKKERIKDFVRALKKDIVEFTGEDDESIEVAQAIQVMSGQALNIFSWTDRSEKNPALAPLKYLRLTADKKRMVQNEKQNEKGARSYIDAESLPEGMREVKEEGKCGFFWRGFEGIKKLGKNILEYLIYNNKRFKKSEKKHIMYIMDHFPIPIPVPAFLEKAIEEGRITSMHETFIMEDLLPGSFQTLSTGAGHLQIHKRDIERIGLFDVKHVTEGSGFQVNVQYNTEGQIVEKEIRKVKKGSVCVSFPGYVDYMIGDNLRFNDFAVPLSPELAKKFDPWYNENEIGKIEDVLKKQENYAPYIAMKIDGELILIEAVDKGGEPIWEEGPDADFLVGKSLINLYGGIRGFSSMEDVYGFVERLAGAIKTTKDKELMGTIIKPHEAEKKVTELTKKMAVPEAPSLGKTRSIYEYINGNERSLSSIFRPDTKTEKLIRIPVELIETEEEKALIDFLNELQKTEYKNVYVEFFSIDENAQDKDYNQLAYENFGISTKEKPEGFAASRSNTITIFPVDKGEKLPASKVNRRWAGLGVIPDGQGSSKKCTISDTIISPVGFNFDTAGIARSILLGINLSEIAGNKEYTKDTNFVRLTLSQYRELCSGLGQDLDILTEEDIVNIARGGTRAMVASLNKLIKCLPIVPLNIEEKRAIYERVREVWIRA